MVTHPSELGSPVTRVTSRHNIPKDAVVLSESEARRLQWDLVSRWKPRYEVWPYSFGIGILGSSAGFAGLILNNHYRKRLKLLDYGKVASTLPLVVMPTILASAFHLWFLSNDILLGKFTCPICMETRSMFVQFQCALTYPLVMAPLASMYLAGSSFHYAIPNVNQYKELFALYKEMNRNLGRKLIPLAILQALVATVIPVYEVKTIDKIHAKIRQKENDRKINQQVSSDQIQ